MAKLIILIDPAEFLDLAKKNGLNRTKAIALSKIPLSNWNRWSYQRGKPKLEYKQKLGEIAINKGWVVI